MKEITIGLFCFVFVYFFCFLLLFFQAAFEGVTGASEADGSFGLFRRLDARLGADGWLNGHPTGQETVETAGFKEQRPNRNKKAAHHSETEMTALNASD